MIERQKLAGDLLAHGPRVVAGLDPEVALAELDDRQKGAGLAVRHRARFEHETILGPMRMDELADQSRFPDSWLADDGDHLSLSRPRLVEALTEVVELPAPPDETGETACRRRLTARVRRRCSDQLEDVYGVGQSLHRDRPNRNNLDETLGEPEGIPGESRGARGRELLHPRGEVGGLAHRSVVHAEIAADRAHDHLAGVEADTN